MQKIYRVGIVGCGNIAEQHLKFLTKMNMAQVVGLADTYIENANLLGDKYGISTRCSSLEALLDAQTIDVLHICTPPAHHYEQAMFALEKGIHVFLEKPLALQASQVAELYDCAVAHQVILCPGFLQLFLPRMVETLKLIRGGKLGKVIQVECFYGFEAFGSEVYKSRKLPWSFELPGGLFHNHLAHPLYLVLSLIGESQTLQVISRAFGVLPQNMTDHLELLIEGQNANAHITMSVVSQTSFYFIRILCSKGAVVVDLQRLSVVLDAKGAQPGVIHRFLSNFEIARQLVVSSIANIFGILSGELVPYLGMQKLFETFYEGLGSNTRFPVSRELAVAVAQAEERIVVGIKKTRPDLTPRIVQQEFSVSTKRILVTGAAGFLGTSIVRELIKAGYNVCAYVRPLSRIAVLEQLGAGIVFGDMREYDGLERATQGMDYIVHAAAGMRGSRDVMLETSLQGVENIARAANMNKIKKVIYISSTGVYDYSMLHKSNVITEQTPLESQPEMRGGYTFAKCNAEEVALANLGNADVAWTILRPSILFGDGRPVHRLLTGALIGNFFFCFGGSRHYLRLVHADDVGVAVICALEREEAKGKVFNVSHPDPYTIGQYFRQAKPTEFGKRIWIVYIPKFVMSTASFVLDISRKIFKEGPNISQRQLAYWYCSCRVGTQLIRDKLGWEPKATNIGEAILANENR